MTVAEYLSSIPKIRTVKIISICDQIKHLYPDAIESMRYKMPTYESNTGWIAIASQKNYLSVYTCSAIHIESFKQKHPNIKTGKGCINFRDRDEIPLVDLAPVIRSAMENSGH